jgi:hypothetical protein
MIYMADCEICKSNDVFYLSCCLCYNKLKICDKHETRTVEKYTKRGTKWYVRLCDTCKYRKLTKCEKKHLISYRQEHCLWENIDMTGKKHVFSYK